MPVVKILSHARDADINLQALPHDEIGRKTTADSTVGLYNFCILTHHMQQRIIVVGAGAAGLIAARRLAKAGNQVLVVEARNRPGGRIQTCVTTNGWRVEAGAEFMHGKLPVTVKLLRECGAKEVAMKGNMYQLRNGLLQRDDAMDEQWAALFRALKTLKEDMSVEAFLQKHFHEEQFAELRKMVKQYAEGYDAADITRMSAIALRDEWGAGNEETQFHIEGGYGKIIRFLCNELTQAGGKILYSTRVKSVHYGNKNVKVITINGDEFEADKIVITAPLGILQREEIIFTPPLPAYTEAARKIGFGGVIKFILQFDEAFWESKISGMKKPGFLFTDAQVPTWWTQLPDRSPIFTGWLGGPRTDTLTQNEEELIAMAIESLSYIFHQPVSEIRQKMKSWMIGNWTRHTFTGGAYAYVTVETPQARSVLQQPVDDTVFFAGEALYSGAEIGTVEAALASGQEVAEKVLKV
jgi:monoamine oxidase